MVEEGGEEEKSKCQTISLFGFLSTDDYLFSV